MRVVIFFILEAMLLWFSYGVDVQRITPWLLGASFTISIFSINFTFFGYQLSKYKAIYDKVTHRQWVNITALIILPFIPLLSYFVFPEGFSQVSLGVLPLIFLSSIDNALLTIRLLNPIEFISSTTKEYNVNLYLNGLSMEIRKEVNSHKEYLKNNNKFQIPAHGYTYEPSVLGLSSSDIWDSIMLVNKLAIENNDYPTFKHTLNRALQVLIQSYKFRYGDSDYHEIDSGINFVTRKRFRSIVNEISEKDKSGIFLNSIANELCEYLVQDEILKNPSSDLTRAIASEAIWVGQKLLKSDSITEPLKVLNTIHRVIDLNVYRLGNISTSKFEDSMDKYNISTYAHDIKSLGVTALNSENHHFAYRCMESLSYIGCNAAKLKSMETVTAAFESIVHLGRLSRNLKIGCFWSRCLISAESHAEEFLGHILTWLVSDLDSNGNFFMKGHAEQAYSRLRGLKCLIKPVANRNPIFWIEEIKSGDETIPHVEYESGMFGYSGKLDYSDFSNLKEYTLHGIGSECTARIMRTEPVPLDLDYLEEGDPP